MRVLFFIEPLLVHNRPFHYWAWLDYSASVFRAFQGSGLDYEFRFVMNEALAVRARAPYDPAPGHPPRRGQGLPPETVITLPQEPVRRIFDAPNTAILDGLHRGRWSEQQLDAYAGLVRERLRDFVPDVVITRTPAGFLRRLNPGMTLFGTELGPFSRSPFPMTTFLDPHGLWEQSILGAHATDLLRQELTDENRRSLERIREHHRPFFRATSPFHGLEERLRGRCRRLALLPLQFAGESGFDLNAPFRSQGEYLFHVLERMPAELGLLVVEHPTAVWVGDAIDEETREYVCERWPNVMFVDFRRAPSAGQYLIHHVDYVLCISSSLGLQAIFWRKPLVAVGRGPFAAFAAFPSVDAIDLAAPPDTGPRFDGALAWLLRHYYPHERFALHDARWLDRFFRTVRAKITEGRDGLELFDPIASLAEVEASLCPALPAAEAPAARSLAGLLVNGRFEQWSRGPGPFRGHGITADDWELIPGAGNLVVVERGQDGEGSFLSLAREKGVGTGLAAAPTLLLQRVADVGRCAGSCPTIRFRARSASGAEIHVYAYQQLDNTRVPSRGTEARVFHLTGEWRTCELEAVLPSVSEIACGPLSNTEIVFMLPGGGPPRGFDLADVELY